MGKGGSEGRIDAFVVLKNDLNIFIHQRLSYKKKGGGWVGGKNIKMIGQKRTEGEVEEKGGGRKEKVKSEQECICCTIKQLSVKVHQIIL